MFLFDMLEIVKKKMEFGNDKNFMFVLVGVSYGLSMVGFVYFE